MSSEEHLAFGQRLPGMCLAQGAGLWPGRGRGGWVKSRGKPGLQGLPTVPGVKVALPPLLCSHLLWDSGSWSLGLFPCSSSSPDLGHPVASVCSVLTSSPYSFLLFPWVSAVVSPPPGSLP